MPCCCCCHFDEDYDTLSEKDQKRLAELCDVHGVFRDEHPYEHPSNQFKAKKIITTPVHLNVYNLISESKNSKLQKIGMALYHTGVEIGRYEYSFGEPANSSVVTGIFIVGPGQAMTGFSQRIYLGETTVTGEQLDTMIKRFKIEWPASRYEVLHRNCNHFSKFFCKRLSTVTPLVVPNWINRISNWADVVVPRCAARWAVRRFDEAPPQSTTTTTAKDDKKDKEKKEKEEKKKVEQEAAEFRKREAEAKRKAALAPQSTIDAVGSRPALPTPRNESPDSEDDEFTVLVDANAPKPGTASSSHHHTTSSGGNGGKVAMPNFNAAKKKGGSSAAAGGGSSVSPAKYLDPASVMTPPPKVDEASAGGASTAAFDVETPSSIGDSTQASPMTIERNPVAPQGRRLHEGFGSAQSAGDNTAGTSSTLARTPAPLGKEPHGNSTAGSRILGYDEFEELPMTDRSDMEGRRRGGNHHTTAGAVPFEGLTTSEEPSHPQNDGPAFVFGDTVLAHSEVPTPQRHLIQANQKATDGRGSFHHQHIPSSTMDEHGLPIVSPNGATGEDYELQLALQMSLEQIGGGTPDHGPEVSGFVEQNSSSVIAADSGIMDDSDNDEGHLSRQNGAGASRALSLEPPNASGSASASAFPLPEDDGNEKNCVDEQESGEEQDGVGAGDVIPSKLQRRQSIKKDRGPSPNASSGCSEERSGDEENGETALSASASVSVTPRAEESSADPSSFGSTSRLVRQSSTHSRRASAGVEGGSEKEAGEDVEPARAPTRSASTATSNASSAGTAPSPLPTEPRQTSTTMRVGSRDPSVDDIDPDENENENEGKQEEYSDPGTP